MAKRLTDEERGFRSGAAIALAILARQNGMPSVAVDILGEMGLTIAQLRSAGVANYDIAPLAKEIRRG